jgi:hypothetical protein
MSRIRIVACSRAVLGKSREHQLIAHRRDGREPRLQVLVSLGYAAGNFFAQCDNFEFFVVKELDGDMKEIESVTFRRIGEMFLGEFFAVEKVGFDFEEEDGAVAEDYEDFFPHSVLGSAH